jgi:hypothetical protein
LELNAGRLHGLTKELLMNKVILAVLVSSAGLCVGTAHAGNLSWSIGINAPGIGTVISNVAAYPVPVYATAPVYSSGYSSGYAPGHAPVYAPVQVYVPEPTYRPVYEPVYRPDYRPAYRPGYAVLPAPVAYPRYGAGYRAVPIAYWRGHDRRHWEPRRDRDDRDHNHHHGGRYD